MVASCVLRCLQAHTSAAHSPFITSNYLFTTTSPLFRFDVDWRCAALVSISYRHRSHCRCKSNDAQYWAHRLHYIARVFGNKAVKCMLPRSAATADYISRLLPSWWKRHQLLLQHFYCCCLLQCILIDCMQIKASEGFCLSNVCCGGWLVDWSVALLAPMRFVGWRNFTLAMATHTFGAQQASAYRCATGLICAVFSK